MSEFESAFLCGLLKKFRPKKFVEIGIATGVTTAIILQCLEDIGQKYYMRSIDISDGEVLDFLTILPYLKNGAIVCLHDVSISHIQVYNAHQYATTALFSSVVADKYFNFILDNQLMLRYPNIAAFQITDDTAKNIENIFLSLIIRWSYMPEGRDSIGYTRAILKNYSQELFLIFQEAVRLNFRSINVEAQMKTSP